MIRVVIDTNVLVSAAMTRGGIPQRLVRGWMAGKFEIYFTEEMYGEIEDVLGRRKIRRSTQLTDELLDDFLVDIRRNAVFIPPAPVSGIVLRDPDDDGIVAAAVAAKADYIVSGDKDLLHMRECCGIPVITAREFAVILGLPGDS